MNRISFEEKGKEGEGWVDLAMEVFGWKVIKFHHYQAAVDRLYYKDGKALLAQVKNKELRKLYPDTGLERSRFENFKEMVSGTGIPGILLFTDSTNEVYGDYIQNLKDEPHGGEFNSVNGTTMIYFWRKDLCNIKDLMSR